MQSSRIAAVSEAGRPASSGTAIAPRRIAPIIAATASRPSGSATATRSPGTDAEAVKPPGGAPAGLGQLLERPPAVVVQHRGPAAPGETVGLHEVVRRVGARHPIAGGSVHVRMLVSAREPDHAP